MGYGYLETSTVRAVSASHRAARRLSRKRVFERDVAPQPSSSTTTTTTTTAVEEAAEEGDTSAPLVPKSHGSGEENTNESNDETNEIDPREKSVQIDM